MSRTNKSGLDGTHKGGVSRNDINTGVEVGGADKGSVGKADIKTYKKIDAETVASTDNSADGGNKVTDQHADLADLMFAALATVNCADNSNLTVLAAITTSGKFLAIFATLANITLEKKSKVCESNPFLFATNHQ